MRDCTDIVRSFLKNEVWKRGFDYGYSGALCGVKPQEVLKAQIAVTGLKDSHCGKKLADSIRDYVPGFRRTRARKLLSTGWRHNYVVTTIELAREFEEKDRSGPSMEFLSSYHQAMAINKEMSALLKAAIQLVYHAIYMPMHSTEDRRAFGFMFINSSCDLRIETSPSLTHTYIAILEPNSKDEFDQTFQLLAEKWHCPLWSIHRFLKAIPDMYADVEGLLDLLFALEGLFDKSASADSMRLCCSILCSRTITNARKVDEILRKAFSIRNEIVHGGKSYSGLEKHNLSTGEKNVWQICWDLKTVVAGMIRLSVNKLAADPKMKNLRITFDDVWARSLHKG